MQSVEYVVRMSCWFDFLGFRIFTMSTPHRRLETLFITPWSMHVWKHNA